MKKNRVLIIVGCVVGSSVLIGIASYVGQQKQMDHAESKNEPQASFVAKPGTEKKGAQGITTSQRKTELKPSQKSPDTPLWGSIEDPDKKKTLTRTEKATKEAASAESPEEAIRILLKRLAAMEGNKQKASLYQELSSYYRKLDPPMIDEAEKALQLSWKYADTLIEKVDAAFYQAEYHMHAKEYGKVLETIDRLETDSLPLTEHALELSMMMGISYEQLNFPDDAQAAYKSLMSQSRAIGLDTHPAVVNVYRQAATHLADMYRKEGKEAEAKALGRLVEESLIHN